MRHNSACNARHYAPRVRTHASAPHRQSSRTLRVPGPRLLCHHRLGPRHLAALQSHPDCLLALRLLFVSCLDCLDCVEYLQLWCLLHQYLPLELAPRFVPAPAPEPQPAPFQPCQPASLHSLQPPQLQLAAAPQQRCPAAGAVHFHCPANASTRAAAAAARAAA